VLRTIQQDFTAVSTRLVERTRLMQTLQIEAMGNVDRVSCDQLEIGQIVPKAAHSNRYEMNGGD
jgi:hypothetical protein